MKNVRSTIFWKDLIIILINLYGRITQLSRITTNKKLLSKKEIKEKRIELLALMNLNSNWYRDEKSELYKKIMRCSEELQLLISDTSKTSRIDKNEYLSLRESGFTLLEISEYYGISISSLNNWRKVKKIK